MNLRAQGKTVFLPLVFYFQNSKAFTQKESEDLNLTVEG